MLNRSKLSTLIRPIKTNLTNCPIVYNTYRKVHNLPFQNVSEMKNSLLKNILKQHTDWLVAPAASFYSWKNITVPNYEGIELPPIERRKLPMYQKVPQPVLGMKPYKMPKAHRYIRGEEEVQFDLLHRQYGIVALRGGHLKHGHFEMMRNGINKKLNVKKAFAVYRVEAPWFSHTKKGIGKRMGGGMGNISYYTTPVKAKRVILEVAGMITFPEVERMLRIVAHKLPFPAAVMTQEMIEKEREEEIRLEKENQNPFTFKYIIQNNMMGSRNWAKKEMDLKYFGKYA